MNTNHKLWKLAKIIKAIMKLELEASNCFEVEWFLDYHNIIRIFFEYSKKLNFK
jgi:hypothetical protein